MNSRFLGGNQPASRAAVFLDRDGVIVRDVHFLRKPSQIDFIDTVDSLADLADRYYLVVATNQSGIARNLFTEEDLLDIHTEVVRQLAARNVVIDAFYYCPHLPTAELAVYRTNCDCRKPGPGLLLRAAREYQLDLKRSYMIGDSRRDIEAGAAVGLAGNFLIGPTVRLREPKSAVLNLAQAVEAILGGAA